MPKNKERSFGDERWLTYIKSKITNVILSGGSTQCPKTKNAPLGSVFLFLFHSLRKRGFRRTGIKTKKTAVGSFFVFGHWSGWQDFLMQLSDL